MPVINYNLKARVEWIKGRQFLGYARNHSVIIDQPRGVGGRDLGFKSRELLLISLGGCLGTRISSLIEEAGIMIKGLAINLKYSDIEQCFTVEVEIKGAFNEDEEEILRKIIKEAEEGCAVSRILRNKSTVNIKSNIESI